MTLYRIIYESIMDKNYDRDSRDYLSFWINDSNSIRLDRFSLYNNADSLIECDRIYKSLGNIWPGAGEHVLPNRTNWHMCYTREKMSKSSGCIWDNVSRVPKEVVQPVVASSMLEFSNKEMEELKILFQNI